MAQSRKSASQAATVATSKGKSTAAGGAEPIYAHPPHLKVHIEDVGKITLSQLLRRRQGPMGTKPGSEPKGSFSKCSPASKDNWISNRRKAVGERGKAVLERDTIAHVQNQLALRSKSFENRSPLRTKGWKGFRLLRHHLSPWEPRTLRVIRGTPDLTFQVMMSAQRILSQGSKVLRIDNIKETDRRWIEEASQQLWKEVELQWEPLTHHS